MGWRRHTGDPADRPAEVFEELIRDDDGVCLGTVMQFYGGHAAYGWVVHNNGAGGATRLGAFTTLDSARAAVEDARVAFSGPGSALPPQNR